MARLSIMGSFLPVGLKGRLGEVLTGMKRVGKRPEVGEGGGLNVLTSRPAEVLGWRLRGLNGIWR